MCTQGGRPGGRLYYQRFVRKSDSRAKYCKKQYFAPFRLPCEIEMKRAKWCGMKCEIESEIEKWKMRNRNEKYEIVRNGVEKWQTNVMFTLSRKASFHDVGAGFLVSWAWIVYFNNVTWISWYAKHRDSHWAHQLEILSTSGPISLCSFLDIWHKWKGYWNSGFGSIMNHENFDDKFQNILEF